MAYEKGKDNTCDDCGITESQDRKLTSTYDYGGFRTSTPDAPVRCGRCYKEHSLKTLFVQMDRLDKRKLDKS